MLLCLQFPALREFVKMGRPVWGTCAGLIFLANNATGAFSLLSMSCVTYILCLTGFMENNGKVLNYLELVYMQTMCGKQTLNVEAVLGFHGKGKVRLNKLYQG